MLITTVLLISPLADVAPAPDVALAAGLDPAHAEEAVFAPALTLTPSLAPQAKTRAKSGRGESESMLSWSFVELHGLSRDVAAVDDEMEGFGGRAAWQFGQGVFLRGGYDVFSGDVDLARADFGVGQSVPLQNGLTAYASVEWVWIEADAGGGLDADLDEHGWRAEAGLRGALDAKLESEARLGYEDVVEEGFVWGLDVRYWVMSQLALGIGFDREVNDNQWTLGVRYAF